VNPPAASKTIQSDQLTNLRGVGPALANRLARLNVGQPMDLLFLVPHRYEDRTRLMPLGALRAGQRVVIEGEIALAEIVYRRRRTLLVRITDGTGQLTLRFFYFSRSQQESLSRGNRIRCFGEARQGPNGLEIIHPEYQLLRNEDNPQLEDRLTPIYPTTEGLQQARLRSLVNQVLQRFLPEVTDLLPADIVAEHNLPTLREAIEYLHRPPKNADLASLSAGTHPCQRRLALEEMLAHHLSLRQVRERNRTESAIPLPTAHALRDKFLDRLNFELTGDQRATLDEVESDLAGAHRLWENCCRRGGGIDRGCSRASSRHHGTDGTSGRAASRQLCQLVQAAGHHHSLVVRWFKKEGPRSGIRRHRRWHRCRDRRHSRVISGRARLQQSGPGHRRRTTSLWCSPAPALDGKGTDRQSSSTSTGDDGHAYSQDPGDDHVCGSGHIDYS